MLLIPVNPSVTSQKVEMGTRIGSTLTCKLLCNHYHHDDENCLCMLRISYNLKYAQILTLRFTVPMTTDTLILI
jgi:hypothetical protein